MTISQQIPLRRNDIDALRVFATFMLFIFHTGMIFNPAPFFHIRNDEVSIVFLIVSGFISLWHMPLFFFLAGWSLYQSLTSRGGRGVVQERLTRIGVPLLVGTALFGPGIKFLELSSGFDMNYAGLSIRADLQESFREVIPSGLEVMPAFNESFVEFAPTFFTQLDRFTWSHLWFLAYLLTFSLLYLPIFRRWAASQVGKSTPTRWRLYAPILVMALIQITLRPHWPGIQNLYNDWANFALYSTYLFLGFAFARNPQLEELAHRERKHAATAGLAACLVLLLAVFEVVTSATLVLAMTAVAGWCFVLALLGFANAHVTERSDRLNYLSEAAYPVYILHQPAIVFLGYPILTLALGITAKFMLITCSSIGLSLLLYHFLLRRRPTLRLLVGMPKMSAPSRAVAPTVAAVTSAALCLFTASPASADTTPAPLGLWWAEGGSAKVRIEQCGGDLCGRVEWLHAPLGRNGCPLTDEYNPSEELRDRPVLGLQILGDLQPSGNVWEGGTIYDPGSGNTYRATLRVIDNDTLELRGYIGIPLIGRSTAWFRVSSGAQRCTAEDEMS